jgi:hypothetical protein
VLACSLEDVVGLAHSLEKPNMAETMQPMDMETFYRQVGSACICICLQHSIQLAWGNPHDLVTSHMLAGQVPLSQVHGYDS